MGEISQLRGLGPKSEEALNAIGITTKAELAAVGAVPAYLRLIDAGHIKPNLNYLYALVSGLEDHAWLDVAREDKACLLMELEGYREMQRLFPDSE